MMILVIKDVTPDWRVLLVDLLYSLQRLLMLASAGTRSYT